MSIRTGWDDDLHRATEEEIRASADAGLLFLPFPYVTPGGAEGTFEAMFPLDAHFINWALLAHGRLDLVRNHILNYLFMVARYGFFPNANDTRSLTRSQIPVFPHSVWGYYLASNDVGLLELAYPLLKQEYLQYWNAPHHQTPTGLATNRDLGDPYWSPALAAEAEVLDWMPIYDGDVRQCVPLITNSALVRYARVLASVATTLGRASEAQNFAEDADTRGELISRYCWSDQAGLFLEYDYVSARQLPYVSEGAYWPLWAGVASREQAELLMLNLRLLEQPYGLSVTDRAYPDPHVSSEYPQSGLGVETDGRPAVAPRVSPDVVGGRGWLQWMYPAGWASTQLIVVEGLDAYGFANAAKRISGRFLTLILRQFEETGRLWEKYNVVDGSLVLPNSRYGNVPFRGWTAAAAVLFGRRVFHDETWSTPSVDSHRKTRGHEVRPLQRTPPSASAR